MRDLKRAANSARASRDITFPFNKLYLSRGIQKAIPALYDFQEGHIIPV